MKYEETVDGLMSKGTINKEVSYSFIFALAETAHVGTMPSLSYKIIPSINLIFNDKPYETFYLLRDTKMP